MWKTFSKKLFLQKWRFLSFLAKYVPKGFSSIFEGSKSVKNGHFWLFWAIFLIFWTTFGSYLVALYQKMRQISLKFDHFCVVPTNCELFLWQKVSKWDFFDKARNLNRRLFWEKEPFEKQFQNVVLFVSKEPKSS